MTSNSILQQETGIPGDRTAPVAKLRLEWVYGYRSANCRSNIHLTENGELVYFSAAIGIVQNIQDKTSSIQRYFLGHDGNIISSCLHPNKIIVATGQMGKTAQICVWNTQEPIKLESLLLGHAEGVAAMSFSADGEKLASVGIDSENTIKIWRWRQGKVLATVSGHTERIFDISYYGENVITCGVKHIRFWTLLGNTLQYKDGAFGKSEPQTLLSIGHFFNSEDKSQTTNEDDIFCFTGAINGHIHVWKKCKIDRFVPGADDSAIYSIDVNPDGFITSSKDGIVQFWTRDFVRTNQFMQIPNALNEPGGVSVCSVASRNGYCVVGTRDCEIYGFDINNFDGSIACHVKGHHDDGLYALACDPRNNFFATGGDDCILRFWNAENMTPVGCYIVPANPVSPPPGIRSLSYSHDGKQIAVGFENGSIEVYEALNNVDGLYRPQLIKAINDRLDSIVSLAYSPSGKYLAVGCIDGNFDIYDVQKQYAHLLFKSTENELSITNIDWTEDDQYFQFTGEHKNAFTGKMPAMEKASDEEIESISNWASLKSFKHKSVKGIWNKFAEKTDIVAIDANEKNHVIAAGDDHGLVKLFRYPSDKRGAHFKKYPGHASRIGDIRFLHDGTRLISIGINDRTIIQWRFISESDSFVMADTLRRKSNALASSAFATDEPVAEIDDTAVEEAHMAHAALHSGAFIESDSEDSDSDLSGAEIDSDIEKERQYSYDRTLYREDYQKLKKSKKIQLPPGEKRKQQPDGGLKLNFVFGYRGYDCRDNVFCLKATEIVYHVAALGIVLNTETNQQRFYNYHTDDILCLAVSPDMNFVATGQIGRNPPVHVWDPISMETKSILRGQHDRGICALGFSKDGKRLASVGLDDYRTIVVWEWRKGEKLMSQRGHNDKIFCLRWNPHAEDRFVTVGIKHIKFWALAGGGMTSKQGLFGKTGGKQGKQNQMCIVFGKTPDLCITGGGDGSIYIWMQTNLFKKVDDAHNGPVFAITAVQDKGFVTGGKDGKVILWDPEFKKKVKVYDIVNKNLATDSRGRLTEDLTSIRSVTLTRRIIVGTRGGEICEIEKEGRIRVVTQGHAEGEMWGLSTHPNKEEICTVSDDKTVRIWSLSEGRMLRFKRMEKLLRACEYSNDGRLIAVGTKDGQCIILNEADLGIIETITHRTQEVSDVKFSPDNSLLAVGTHDNFIDIYKVESRKRVGICKANSSYITHVDWDAKGKLIMTNSGDRQQLFYEAPRGTRITSIKTTDIENMKWFTWTGVLGLVCEGIWPPASDITDVNATHLTKDNKVLATADDFGLVKLFDFPVKGKHAKFKRYTGHSAHVTRVRWTYDDSYLVSIGGRDVATLVWKHDFHREIEPIPVASKQTPVTSARSALDVSSASSTGLRQERGESDDSDNTDSEEEGYDSDVQHDRDMDYTKRMLVNPIRAKNEQTTPPSALTQKRKPIRSKVKPSNKKVKDEIEVVKVALKAGLGFGLLNSASTADATDDENDAENKSSGRVVDLQLDHIHGYRGFDCRDNLFYLADNESIVYPAAGAGVVHHIPSGNQQFYLNHTDDIISMAVHNGQENGNIVASGQIGENPTIHVWDPKTRKTLSVLSGRHKKGVCSLSFSTKGRLLLSVGVESPYTIAVWRWKEGVNVACTVASEDRIFRALFRTNSDTQFVSAGVKHLKFWSVAGNTLVGKKAIITNTVDGTRSTKMQTMLSIAFGQNDRTYTGSMTGLVFIWSKNILERSVVAHLGPIFSIFTTNNSIITGAKERRSTGSERVLQPLKSWDLELNNGRTIGLNVSSTDVICVRSVCVNAQGKILVGLKTSDIIEIDERSSNSRFKSLVFGHGEGELWALSTHPTKPVFVTGSYDQNLIIWDIKTKGLITKRNMSKPIRSVTFHPKGKLIAVGFKDGQISLVNFTIEQKKIEDIHKTRERNSDIVCLKFSPSGEYLVASSQGCTIDIFKVLERRLTRIGYVTHIQDVVIQIDWSTDSKYIRATTACYSAVVYSAPSMEEVKSHSEIEKITWNTWTSIVGDDIIGIWPKDAKKDHVNCAHATSSTIATGDDNGAVNLYRFPCPEAHTEPKSFYGHSANVTNVRFLANERYLISLGGDDCCVFVWKCITSSENASEDN